MALSREHMTRFLDKHKDAKNIIYIKSSHQALTDIPNIEGYYICSCPERDTYLSCTEKTKVDREAFLSTIENDKD